MHTRSRPLAIWLSLGCTSGAVVLAACVGDDPVVGGVTPGEDSGQADTSSALDGAAAADAPTDATPAETGADAAPPGSRLVFVTKGSFGVDTAAAVNAWDTHCHAAASGSTLANVKAAKFVAWVSTANVSAASRAQVTAFTGAFTMPDGTVIAQGGADLLDGSLIAPIDHDENGDFRVATMVWTGTTASGVAVTGSNCGDWMVAGVTDGVALGNTIEKTARWTNSPPPLACNATDRAVYCFQVP